jgi:hypothetical protein
MFLLIVMSIPILGLILFSFWSPLISAYIFIGSFVLLEGWILLASSNAKNINFKEDFRFSEEEQKIVKKYFIAIQFPFFTEILSMGVRMVQMATIIWVPWLLFNELWLPSLIIGVNYFIAGALSVKTNPRFFLHDAVKKRNRMEFLYEMTIVDIVFDKFWNMRRDGTKIE